MASSGDGTARSCDQTLKVPVLGALKLTPRSFAAGKGTTVSYTDTRAARTTFVVQRREGKKWVTVGRFSHRDRAGSNRVSWSGRVNGHALKAGKFRLEATPSLAKASGPTVTVAFTVTG